MFACPTGTVVIGGISVCKELDSCTLYSLQSTMGGTRDWLNQGWLESSQDTQQVQLEKRAGKKGEMMTVLYTSTIKSLVLLLWDES